LPQFVRLDFKTDGTLEAPYVAAGGALAKVINTPSKAQERARYLCASWRSSGEHHRRLASARIRLRRRRQAVLPSGDTAAIVYQKAGA
jgi:hypothetical protein